MAQLTTELTTGTNAQTQSISPTTPTSPNETTGLTTNAAVQVPCICGSTMVLVMIQSGAPKW